ncbi:MAG: fumarylacetoacetate hydrolase family protein, partial [archaeon]|nr:fumarylacetoacetate hydrolase family protein [archaeon]
MQKEDISNKRPWLKSKSLDTFGPIGPQIVKPEDIGNINNLTIETRLNGKIVQSGNTSQMIHKVDEIIEYVSKYFTLEPSDIIITGTPKGVGPMKIGDIIEVEIENIGVLKNQVV